MTESTDNPIAESGSLPRPRAFPPLMVLAALATAMAATAIWVLATWLLGFPLVFLPLGMGAAVGAVVGKGSPQPGIHQGIFAGGIALAHGVVGNVAATFLMATPPEVISSLHHTWRYLQNPGRLRRVLGHTFTPMDVLIYGFVALAAYMMVVFYARRKTPEPLPMAAALPSDSPLPRKAPRARPENTDSE